MPVDYGTEDSCEGVVVKFEEAEYVEVPKQTRGDVVPPPPRRPHRTHHHSVDNRLPRHVLKVVPGNGLRTKRMC